MTEEARAGDGSRSGRARIAEVFGDVLPDVTADERETWGERAAEHDATDRWYRENRPPHHG